MFGIGISEILIIALVALLVVGPKRLPDLARSLGKGFSEFKRSMEGVTEDIKESLRAEDTKENVHDMKDSLLYGQRETEPVPPPAGPPPEDPKKTDPYADHKSGSPS